MTRPPVGSPIDLAISAAVVAASIWLLRLGWRLGHQALDGAEQRALDAMHRNGDA